MHTIWHEAGRHDIWSDLSFQDYYCGHTVSSNLTVPLTSDPKYCKKRIVYKIFTTSKPVSFNGNVAMAKACRLRLSLHSFLVSLISLWCAVLKPSVVFVRSTATLSDIFA